MLRFQKAKMSRFATAMNASARTWNGALSYASPDVTGEASGRLSLFVKGVRGLNVPQLYTYLQSCVKESLVDTFLLCFHLRDCRGGKGERELGRQAMRWLAVNFPDEFRKVFKLLPEYGRWDDLILMFPKALDTSSVETIRANFLIPSSQELASGESSQKINLESIRSLQQEIVRFVGDQLKSDVQKMNNGEPCSLCAKWVPSEGDSVDRKFGVFKTLCDAMKISQKKLRKNFNTPLRAYLKVVETFMCSGKWDGINFNQVPSCAMKKLKKAFAKHDPERFKRWQEALKKGDPKIAKVNAKQLHPHELVRELRTKGCDSVTEAQWNVVVDEVRKLGSLKDAVVVVDTSGSMESPDFLPLDVAVAMGLVISDVVVGPFHGHVINFNTVPSFTVVQDGDLMSRFNTIRGMQWGGSTDLEASFKMILERGKQCGLTQEDMPKRLIIVSDMQFNQIGGGSMTNMERIDQLYQLSGFKRPQIVFWNVNGASTDFPVTKDHYGTAMISGFSPDILKSLLKGEEYSPMSVLRTTLDDQRYAKVKEALIGPKEEVTFEVKVDMAETAKRIAEMTSTMVKQYSKGVEEVGSVKPYQGHPTPENQTDDYDMCS